MSKIFLAMREDVAPSHPKTKGGTSSFWQQKGAHPSSGNPLMYYFDGGHAKKSDHFLDNISQTKNSISSLNMAFLSLFDVSKREGRQNTLK
jgi:hypothetical protein